MEASRFDILGDVENKDNLQANYDMNVDTYINGPEFMLEERRKRN